MSATPPSRKPADMPTVTPHLVCDGAAAAIDFYQRAFGAVEAMRLPTPDGKLMHAMVRIGESPVMLVDEWPEAGVRSPKALQGTPVTLHLYVEDVDAAVEKAVAAGATVAMAPDDMFWGDRYAQVVDPFGHRWSIAHHVRDMSPAEIQAAVAAMGPDTGCGPGSGA
jgi:PhnB protein